MKWFENGILIQELKKRDLFIEKYAKTFIYGGVHALNTAPLVWFEKDKEAYELFRRQNCKKIGENEYESTDFFTDMELLKAYIAKCSSLQIPLRFLFVESNGYTEEIWPYEMPNTEFLGYEVMEIPLDPWTLLDLANREQYEKYRQMLNENGLFKTEEEAMDFREIYQKELDAGLVGDGPVDLYVCKIYEVALPDLLRILDS